ncbi:MAG TPA: Rieske 2Fe-2S domain-containing protein [Thermoanaerobaculia bacterium]|nr:Rieske 2Fe-2S domain-containing protein [Thermoanaerobaculia bacterium]
MATDWRIPDRLQSWYRVCGSRELPAGKVLRWDLPGRSFAVYRGRDDGQVHALAAHCSHMGTHLAHGSVVGNDLRCPLHHWEWGGDGACRRIPGAEGAPRSLRQRVYPVAERHGSVFLFNGPVPRYPAPDWSTAGEGGSRTLAGAPVRLRCPWAAIAANGFDIQHLQTVHGRALRTEPALERLDSHRLRMRYVSQVTGRTLEDRTIQWLSGDHIEITVTCFGGTVITVESSLGERGKARSALMLCLRPVEDGVEIVPIFGVRHGWLDAARVHLARWLYSGFIRKDVAFMDDMRFHPSAGGPFDTVLNDFLAYLRQLPEDVDDVSSSLILRAGGVE